MVYCKQYHCFDKLSLYRRTFYGDDRLTGEYRSSLRYAVYVALEFKIFEIIEEFLAEASASEIFDILIGEAEIFKILNQLFNACHYCKAAVVRNVSEKHIKLNRCVAFAVEEIAVCHGYLVKVGKHCEISLFKIVHFEHRLRINIAIIALHIPFFNPDRNNFII